MAELISFTLGGIVIAYWRDLKFKDWVNSKVLKRHTQEKTNNDKCPII